MDLPEIITALKKHPDIKTKTRIAELCGISLPSLLSWSRVPDKYVLRLEDACGGAVNRHQMRPDVFGPEPNHGKDASVD